MGSGPLAGQLLGIVDIAKQPTTPNAVLPVPTGGTPQLVAHMPGVSVNYMTLAPDSWLLVGGYRNDEPAVT